MADAQLIQIQNVGVSPLDFDNVDSTIVIQNKSIPVGNTYTCYSPIDEVIRDLTLYNYINTNAAILILNGVAQAKIPTLRWFNTAGISPAMVGDVDGTSNFNVVRAIQGTAVAVTAPTLGQVLAYNGVNYAPVTPAVGSVSRTWLTVNQTAFVLNIGTGRFELTWSNVLYDAFDLIVNLNAAIAGKYAVILPLVSGLTLGSKSDRNVVLLGRDPAAFLQVRPNPADTSIVIGNVSTAQSCALLERSDTCFVQISNESAPARRIVFQNVPTTKAVAVRNAAISSAGFAGGGAPMVWDTALVVEDEDQFTTSIVTGYNLVSPAGLRKKVRVSFSLAYTATNATTYTLIAYLLNVNGEIPGSRITGGGQGNGDNFSMSHSVNTIMDSGSFVQLRIIQTNFTGNFTRATMNISTL